MPGAYIFSILLSYNVVPLTAIFVAIMDPTLDSHRTAEDKIAEKAPAYVSQDPEPTHQRIYQRETVLPLGHQQSVLQRRFTNAFPLSALNMSPAPVDCPVCSERELTRIDYVSGNHTQYIPYYLF